MVELSYGAQRTLDQYLRQVKAYLRASRSVDVTDVEQSIHEHIETELEGRTEPVSADQVASILKKLGSPRQWVPDEELPWWRRMLLGLQVGPEDWRLAYLSFGLLVAGMVCLTYGGPIWVLGLASFLVARAGLSAASDLDELKAQKWLMYPGLLVIYIPLLLFILFWPAGILLPIAADLDQFEWLGQKWLVVFGSEFESVPYWITVTCIVITVSALWWALAGLIALKRPNLIKSVFYPFAERLESRKTGYFWAVVSALFVLGFALTWFLAGRSPEAV